jgi:predicted RNase H-like nuclease (RuvC/YqgF family)
MTTKQDDFDNMSDMSDHSSSKPNDVMATATAKLPLKPVFGNPMKRVIDESKLSQDDAEKLEKRRAYNRESASRSRKRTKHLVRQLQNEVAKEKQEKLELQKKNEELQARLALLERHNQTLLLKHLVSERQQASMTAAAAVFPGTGVPLGAFSGGLPTMMLSGLGPNGY